MGYIKEAIFGIAWVGVTRGLTRVVAFAKIAIIARILLPEQFGLFGIATLVLAFLEILIETGVNVFLIQEKKNIDDYINTAWVVSIIRGFFISGVLMVIAPLIASFFDSPVSLEMLRLIAIVPFVRGLINPSIVKFQKELHFRREFWFRTSIFIVDAIAAVIFTIALKSAVGLILGMIVGALAEVVLSFVAVKPTPKLVFEFAKVKKIIDRGKWVMGAGMFQYLFRQGDDIVVGKLLGAGSLGLYTAAYKISTLPITEVADVVSRVTFPVYSKIAGDKMRLRKAFTKTALSVFVLVIPFSLAIFLFSKQIVLVLLGNNWLAAVPVLKVLAIFGALKAVSNSVNPLLLAMKKQQYVTAITFVSILGLAASIIPLIRMHGVIGAGYATIVGSAVAVPFILYYLIKTLTK